MNHQASESYCNVKGKKCFFFRGEQRGSRKKKRKRKKREDESSMMKVRRLSAILSRTQDHPSNNIELEIRPANKIKNGKNDFIRRQNWAPSRVFFHFLLLLLLLLKSHQLGVQSYCPFKCQCDDQLLLANCTQVPSITIVPMTLNPLLRQLTLSHLPMFELSNSLSVYRQLEYLNLSSNQLKQIRYENFNSKPPPASVVVVVTTQHLKQQHPSINHQPINRDEFNANNQQLARQHKQTIDKSIDFVLSTSEQVPKSTSLQHQQQQLDAGSTSASDEIRFHLRHLDLSDNKIEQLGNLFAHHHDDTTTMTEDSSALTDEQQPSDAAGRQRLKSADLERLAPFLTLTKLMWLSLAGNRLARLHQHVFLGLIHLKWLDLSRNQLEIIDRHAFVGLIELEGLDLSRNKLARHLQSLGMSICRAPMNELEHLNLGANYATQENNNMYHHHQQQSQIDQIVLPNQIFICAPRLRNLQLNSLKLRYIQVNAFDNLHQLESLNLSQNLLDQVPLESLISINSNLSLSLKRLDLSDTQIEFIQAGSFGGLRNLQKLSMNSMPNLVSFDLASLISPPPKWLSSSLVTDYYHQQQQASVDKLMRHDSSFREAVSGLLPNHLLSRIVQQNPNFKIQEAPNDDSSLQELQMRYNKRLQSFHSSSQFRMKFSKLRLLDLSGSSELRELPLDKMIDFSYSPATQHLHLITPSTSTSTSVASSSSISNTEEEVEAAHHRLRVDLSFATNLNCSSCQMSWLIEAVQMSKWTRRQQHVLNEVANDNDLHGSIELVSSPHSIGCSAPMSLTLGQLIDLESSFSPLFGHCQRRPEFQFPSTSSIIEPDGRSPAPSDGLMLDAPNSTTTPTTVSTWQMELDTRGSDESGATMAIILAPVCILVMLLLVGGGKLISRRRKLKQLHSTTTTGPSSLDSNSNTNSTSSPGGSSSSQSAFLSSAATAAGLRYSSAEQAPPIVFHRFVNFSRQQQQQQQHFEQQQPLTIEQTQQKLGWPANLGPNERNHHRRNSPWLAGGGNQRLRGNLFSRIVGQLRGSNGSTKASSNNNNNNICSGASIGGWRHGTLLASQLALSSANGAAAGGGGEGLRHTHIIENVVYGGHKILAGSSLLDAAAAANQPAYFVRHQHQQQQDTIKPPPSTFRPLLAVNQQPLKQPPKSMPVAADSFIRGDAGSRPQSGGTLLYANCYQELNGSSSSCSFSTGAPPAVAAGQAAYYSCIEQPPAYGGATLTMTRRLVEMMPSSQHYEGETCRPVVAQAINWPERLNGEQQTIVALESPTSTQTTTSYSNNNNYNNYNYSSGSSAATRLPHEVAQLHLVAAAATATRQGDETNSKRFYSSHASQVGHRGPPPSNGEQPDGAHIYVTLDRPIKQRNGCDEYRPPPSGQLAKQQQQQDGIAFKGFSQQRADNDSISYGCSGEAKDKTTTTNGQISLGPSDSGRHHSGLKPEQAAVKEEYEQENVGQFKLNNRSSDAAAIFDGSAKKSPEGYAARRKKLNGDAEVEQQQQQQPLEVAARSISSSNGSGSRIGENGNVTSHTQFDGSDSSNFANDNDSCEQLQRPSRNRRRRRSKTSRLFMDELNGFAGGQVSEQQEAKTLVARMMDAPVDVTTGQQQWQQITSKYDANHDVSPQRAAQQLAGPEVSSSPPGGSAQSSLPVETACDNDYVINGLNTGASLNALRSQHRAAATIAESAVAAAPSLVGRQMGVVGANQQQKQTGQSQSQLRLNNDNFHGEGQQQQQDGEARSASELLLAKNENPIMIGQLNWPLVCSSAQSAAALTRPTTNENGQASLASSNDQAMAAAETKFEGPPDYIAATEQQHDSSSCANKAPGELATNKRVVAAQGELPAATRDASKTQAKQQEPKRDKSSTIDWRRPRQPIVAGGADVDEKEDKIIGTPIATATATATTAHEIYSNQFYYCRPSLSRQ